MPVTRSASRQSSVTTTSANGQPLTKRRKPNVNQEEGPTARAMKEETSKGKKDTTKKAPAKSSKKSQAQQEKNPSNGTVENPAFVHVPLTEEPQALLPAVLSFSLDDAKRHLFAADPRFEDLFSRLKCRPFEHLERVDPFRTLATSILGQQISWLAARSITHRFIRLFDPSLPEKPLESGSSNPDSFFPSARQVAAQDLALLRTAGLSGRKAEYVQDLAGRFADGRLSNEKIMQANDEELYEMLTAVRGIGKWTVDMFAMFSLRRPDIMPVGDLGVQRGIVRWFLSLHSPKHAYTISPRKLPTPQTESKDANEDNGKGDNNAGVVLPELGKTPRATTPDAGPFPPAPISSAPPVTPVKGRKRASNAVNPDDVEDPEVPMPPPAFTPSINRTLNKVLPTKYHPPPLPEGLSVKELQSRLEGKKKIKGAILTPKEMEDLTESWRPYRSLGVYYMWALAEGDKS